MALTKEQLKERKEKRTREYEEKCKLLPWAEVSHGTKDGWIQLGLTTDCEYLEITTKGEWARRDGDTSFDYQEIHIPLTGPAVLARFITALCARLRLLTVDLNHSVDQINAIRPLPLKE